MSTTRWLDPQEQRAWRSWVDLNAQLTARLNRHLQATSGLSLPDYEILVVLTDPGTEGHSLRMFELGERLQWEKSRVSKQVSRMESRGLLARRECLEDRRGAWVDLTPTGLEAIESAAPAHVELVREIFFEGATDDQIATIGDFATAALARLT